MDRSENQKQFENRMTKGELIAGCTYLPLHYVVLPILIPVYAYFSVSELSATTLNMAYYAIGILFLAIFMRRYIRDQFDVLLDNITRCLLSLVMAIAMYFALAYIISALLLLFMENFSNPNSETVTSLAHANFGTMFAISVFMAPLVEEVLFRGVVFGGLRKKSRAAAYIISTILFCFYHVWQYAMLDISFVIYAVQYIPHAIALAYAYDRSGSIYTPIVLHMLLNALAFYASTLL